KIRNKIKKEIEKALEKSFAEPLHEPDTQTEVSDMYASHQQKVVEPTTDNKSVKRFIDAISDAIRQSMERYPELLLMGQDVAEYGGVFKITEGFVGLFGKERIRNTPLCESAIVGIGLGLSIKGHKSI